MDCLFCSIVKGEIPSKKVYEDDMVYAFRDIHPMAPTHVLIVPKCHIQSADEVTEENSRYVAHIFEVIPKIAKAEGLTNGYRVITNCGEDGCQSVKHLHFHLLGGKKLPRKHGVMTLWEELLESGNDLLWEKLRRTEKKIVLYGMGNGADKILDVCAKKSIPVQGVFASDGFRTGKQFRGMTVESRRDILDRFGRENTVVLLAFASSRPEVLNLIRDVAAEAELYVPDVPVAGSTLFDADFARAHRNDLLRARDLLCDEESRRIFDLTVAAKLTGRAEFLFRAVSDPAETMRESIRPEEIRTALDLGAYTGDTVRELLNAGAKPETVYAVEPDARTFRKLAVYAEQETRTTVVPLHAAAWNRRETLAFGAAGNRGSAVGETVKKTRPVDGIPMDEVLGDARVDYVKFDVEGAEREAIEGLSMHLARDLPTLLVSVYHRSEDLFTLPLFLHERFGGYGRFFLRRFSGLPAWDLNLYVRR